ncbi:hypothetical protein [Streptomyces yanii]|uniref:hypothetical protein n=1 Tax=Streptomyces yanii TaxID=78510 RepID=UPI0031E8CE3C
MKDENLDRLAAEGVAGSINLGSWGTRQVTRWKALEDGRRQLVAALDLTLAPSTLPTRPATRRTFAEAVQLLELFLHRERRAPAAREAITVDGDTVRIGPGSPRCAPSTVRGSSTLSMNASSPPSSTATGPPRTLLPPSPDLASEHPGRGLRRP